MASVKIRNWSVVPFGGENSFVLVGKIENHPKYGNDAVRTGIIIDFNEEEGYADTRKTHYILGDSNKDILKKMTETTKDVKNQVNQILTTSPESVE